MLLTARAATRSWIEEQICQKAVGCPGLQHSQMSCVHPYDMCLSCIHAADIAAMEDCRSSMQVRMRSSCNGLASHLDVPRNAASWTAVNSGKQYRLKGSCTPGRQSKLALAGAAGRREFLRDLIEASHALLGIAQLFQYRRIETGFQAYCTRQGFQFVRAVLLS